MKSYPVNKPVMLYRLHEELAAAGVPVQSVRLFANNRAEVVAQDSALDAVVATVIAAHVAAPNAAERLNALTISTKVLAAHNAVLAAMLAAPVLTSTPVPAWAKDAILALQVQVNLAD